MRWQMRAYTCWAVILSALVLQDVEGQGRVKCAELEGQQGEEPPPEICPTQETLVFEIRNSETYYYTALPNN